MISLKDLDFMAELERRPYKEYCLNLASVCESVMFLHRRLNPGDKALQEAINAIRRYHKGRLE